jgi:hypothetical protein
MMGYGEVGGGGSLQWQMTHNNRKKAGGLPVHVPPIAGKPPQQGEAIDPDVNDGTDLFILIKRGVIILADANQILVRVSLASHDDVQLVWGAQSPAPASLQSIASAVGQLDLSSLEADRGETV